MKKAILTAAMFLAAVCAGFAAAPGFVRVEGGAFERGRCPSGWNVTPVRQVTVSGFYMGRFPVTQGEWYDVMGTRPSYFTLPGNAWRNLPVDSASWYDAIVFANRLSIARGLTPVYSIAGSTNPGAWGAVPTSRNAIWDTVTMNSNANGYRLPTEAEWEFAARGGTVCTGNFRYSGSNVAREVAWHAENSGRRTHPVGQLRPNALGLYDMSGNVREWVWDWHGPYPIIVQTNPTGAPSGSNRVFRGGSWFVSNWALRPVNRNIDFPASGFGDLGFRLVRSL